ncbi:penicillin-binding protein 1A [Desulfosoma caldarium]|uniref:Penicillin-binding protein 1A n=1 Tax=Desulfosoma caldarium TaxID=610254 RepID=A0A3N1VL28_9BACT|nr:PBP1A family penicillin-binding protein [Desulfosoma caldarium]ROR03493.1 penicillin-binding protein 1A [Desulfosoma caldarium]
MEYRKTNPSQHGFPPLQRPYRVGKLIAAGAVLLISGTLALLAATAAYFQLERSLPSIQSLRDYRPSIVTTMYAADGTVIGEFAAERRYVRHLEEFPRHVILAFLAAEDANFYEHKGLDFGGIVRAMIKNIEAGGIVQGGSTITQQVVKTFLLSPERTWVRKLKEAILAYRIDRSMTKNEILYLYLNQIYLGAGAYGVEAAARTYFGIGARDLSIAQAALLAGLPKAPSRYSPFQNMDKALKRQHYVLDRMVEVGFLSQEEALRARQEPLHLMEPPARATYPMNSFTEEVRRLMEQKYGARMLYREGLSIHTTMDVHAQRLAEKAIVEGLRQLDKRHGYRGPHGHVADSEAADFSEVLAKRYATLSSGDVVEAMVMGCESQKRRCRLDLGAQRSAVLNLKAAPWAAGYFSSRRHLFSKGDLIWVRVEAQGSDTTPWLVSLEQEPQTEGALLAMNPQTGRVVCMVGGKDFSKSQFNRATQAYRQPGSAFKPIIYATALEKGSTESSMLIDSPIIKEDPSLVGPWKPANYDNAFWGPITLRDALIHSRNVVAIKLLESVGIHEVHEMARRLGIRSPLTPTLSLALGASGVSLWELVTAYSAFAAQGLRVEPYMVEAVYDRNGRLLEKHQVRQERALSAQTAYIITDILQGVIREGTGRSVRSINRPAAGKTGTTNEMKDAWFVGYTPELLTGVWVGHDDHRLSLGPKETGGRAAAPIWLSFMQEYLRETPAENFPVPENIVFAKIPSKSNKSQAERGRETFAAFVEGTQPKGPQDMPFLEGPSSESAAEITSGSFFKSDLFWGNN